jgi:hypothetical protein
MLAVCARVELPPNRIGVQNAVLRQVNIYGPLGAPVIEVRYAGSFTGKGGTR